VRRVALLAQVGHGQRFARAKFHRDRVHNARFCEKHLDEVGLWF
jgi:hypothetical protein